jgi:general secretion pathway protein G
MRRYKQRKSAFTLLEVILVLLIIGLLVGMVAPALFGTKEKANRDAARNQIGLIYDACDIFRLHMNEYPSSLDQLVANPGVGSKWAGPYLDKLPKDPWNHEFVYEFQPGSKPIILSMGPDGQANTADDIHREDAE